MSKETWKDYYYKHFESGVHDVGREAVKATYEYQQRKIDNLDDQIQDLIERNEELRVESFHFETSVQKLLEAVAWYKMYLAPGGKPYMLEKAEECFMAANIKEN